jgi:hypothetical protein
MEKMYYTSVNDAIMLTISVCGAVAGQVPGAAVGG